jgi:hypothetical protein
MKYRGHIPQRHPVEISPDCAGEFTGSTARDIERKTSSEWMQRVLQRRLVARIVATLELRDRSNFMEAGSKRRWFQFHLSTVLLLTSTVGILMWKNYESIRALRPGTTSPFVTTNGLSHRLSIQNNAVTINSPAEFKLELRNDSNAPFAIFTERMGWDEMEICSDSGVYIPYVTTALNSWKKPTVTDYTVLQPGKSIEQHFSIPIEIYKQVYMVDGDKRFTLDLGKFLARAKCSMNARFNTMRDQNGNLVQTKDLLGAPVWNGEIRTDPVAFEIFRPWSSKEVAAETVFAVFVLGLVASISEWIICARRKHSLPTRESAELE